MRRLFEYKKFKEGEKSYIEGDPFILVYKRGKNFDYGLWLFGRILFTISKFKVVSSIRMVIVWKREIDGTHTATTFEISHQN